MPSGRNWAEEIRKNLFSAEAHCSHDQSNVTYADRFSDCLKNLSRVGSERGELLDSVLELLRVEMPAERTLALINFILESLKPLTEAEKDSLKEAVFLQFPPNPSARGYLLRFLVCERTPIDWQSFSRTKNWRSIAQHDPLLAADTLVYAGEFDSAQKSVHSALRAKRIRKSDALTMVSRWHERVGLQEHQPQQGLARFLQDLGQSHLSG